MARKRRGAKPKAKKPARKPAKKAAARAAGGIEEYYPLVDGRAYVYRYASPEFQNGKPGVSRMTFSEVRKEKGATLGKLTEVITNGKEWGTWVSAVRRTAAQVLCREQFSGVETMLLKGPIRKGTSWEDGPYEVEIGAVRERVRAPAGTFVCVRVSYWSEDIGGGSRWYAPGVGLVKAEQRGEHLPFDYKLTSVEGGKTWKNGKRVIGCRTT